MLREGEGVPKESRTGDTVSLQAHIERIFTERQAAIDAAFAAAQQSQRDRNVSIDERLEKLNELRQEVTADRGQYMTRSEYEAKHDALEASIQAIAAAIDARLKAMEGWRFRASGIFLVLVPLAGVIGAAIVRAFG